MNNKFKEIDRDLIEEGLLNFRANHPGAFEYMKEKENESYRCVASIYYPMVEDIERNIENCIYREVIKFDVNVDKKRLFEILAEDRNAYREGFYYGYMRNFNKQTIRICELEKALDKAANQLYIFQFNGLGYGDSGMTKEEWKEWLLSENNG